MGENTNTFTKTWGTRDEEKELEATPPLLYKLITKSYKEWEELDGEDDYKNTMKRPWKNTMRKSLKTSSFKHTRGGHKGGQP